MTVRRIATAVTGALVGAALSGCSSFTFEGVPLAPTGQVQSPATTRPPEYVPVGVRPRAAAPEFTAADRQRLQSGLSAARQQSAQTVTAPLDQPLPPNAPVP